MFNGTFKGKRILVTGHRGFKGSWLSLWLQRLGAEVAGFSLGVPSEPSHFKVLELGKTLVKDYDGDIRDFSSLKKAFDEFRPEIVFHLAAEVIVRTCYENPKQTFDTNLGGTVNLLEAIRQSDSVKAAVIITSDKCYENVEWEHGYRESDRLGGKDPYSASKACAELAFYSYFHSYFKTQDKVQVASARAGNVIGGGDWARDRIVPDCVRAWSEGKPVLIRSPQATRPWQHVLEPLSGYLTLAARLYDRDPGVQGESFNFGPNTMVEYPVLNLIQEMGKHWPWPTAQYVVSPEKTSGKKEASLLKLACDKAQSRLNWRALLDFSATAEFTSYWYRTFYREPGASQSLSLEQIQVYEQLAKDKGMPWAHTPVATETIVKVGGEKK